MIRLTKSVAISLLLLSGFATINSSPINIKQIFCDGKENPAGTGASPVFGWISESSSRNKVQTAWQILISSGLKKADKSDGDIWDSGKSKSEKSAWIPYSGPALQSGREYFWKVRIWDGHDKPSEWSSTGKFITGLFEKKNWNGARWIGYEDIPDSLLLVPGVHGNGDHLGPLALKRTVIPYFRKEFSVSRKVEKALVFISGLGQYELSLNGEKVGNSFLSPGWTDYRKTCYYNTYDITENLKQGINTIGTIVGNGFYNINRERYRKLVIAYGAPKMILRLLIRYTDGSEEVVISDRSWKTSPSPITFSSIYGGEDFDARLEKPDWCLAGFDDTKWQNAIYVKEPAGTLKPESDFPLKVEEIITCKKISVHNDSTYLFDFGQNGSGIIKLQIHGKSGQEVLLIPGELLGSDSLVTQAATGAPYYFSYILKGGDEEIWMPRFTYYGFRYVEVRGAVPENHPNPGKLPLIRHLQFLHTRNSSPEAGSFSCSNDLFNSIFTLIKWSVKSNLASVATDCPHREKLGWLEQTHLMGNSVRFLYNIHNLFSKVIDDMAEAQLENGLVPDIAPEYVPFEAGFRDSPEWGSASVILPWYMYEWYGDIDAIRKAYPMMKKYLGYLEAKSDKHIISHGLGDWYDLGPEFPGEAQLTPKAVTATSIYYYDTKLMAKMAGLTGHPDDADFYRNRAEEIRNAFNAVFFNPLTKVYSTGSQTAMSMPLFFGMVDDSLRNDVEKNLTRSIIQNNKALTAGDIGYRYLLRALEEAGESQLIFDMNSKTDVPGYGFQLSKGATSLTESWAALRDVSNNHMMLGHLMEWFFSGIGGLRQPEGFGSYDRIIIAPEIVGDLTWAETTYNSIHGEILSNWKIEGNVLTMKVRIPVGCKATVSIPQSNPDLISEGKLQLKKSRFARISGTSEGRTLCEVPSGEYIFSTVTEK